MNFEKQNMKNGQIPKNKKEMKKALKDMLSFERYVDMNNIVDELQVDCNNLKKDNIVVVRDVQFMENKIEQNISELQD